MKRYMLLISLLIASLLTIPDLKAESYIVKNENKEKKPSHDYNRITVGFDMMFQHMQNAPQKKLLIPEFKSIYGLNLSYIHGFSISHGPVFIESGVELTYNHRIKEFEGFLDLRNQSQTLYSIGIPLNVAYKIKLGNNFSIFPFTGINFNINAGYDYKSSYYNEYSGNTDFYTQEERTASHSFFQIAWNWGIGFHLREVYIGAKYSLPFNKLAKISGEYKYVHYFYYKPPEKKYDSFNYILKSSNLTISLGVLF